MSALDPIKWCEDRLLVPGNPLGASLLFVDSDARAQILALRAIITEIASNAQLTDEPGLAEAKLGWWRDALIEQRNHPAIEAWLASDGGHPMLIAGLVDLIEGVRTSLDQTRYETVEQAWGMCEALGGQAFVLEFDMLYGAGAPANARDGAKALGAFAYWVRSIRDLALDARQGRWFVPLTLQAEYQIARHDLDSGINQRRWSGLVQSLVSVGLSMVSEAEKVLHQAPAAYHLLLTHALDKRLAKQLVRSPKRMLRQRLLPSHAGNVWVAWRHARQLKKSK